MMETARTSETLVNFYQTTRRYNPEDSHLNTWKLLPLSLKHSIHMSYDSLKFPLSAVTHSLSHVNYDARYSNSYFVQSSIKFISQRETEIKVQKPRAEANLIRSKLQTHYLGCSGSKN
jgi:hypothetical protein